jgi:hypothetical protein
MFEGVGRRRDTKGGQLVSIGEKSLNGNERDCLFRNDGAGAFTDVSYVNRTDRVEDGRGVSIFDYDLDGKPDIALRNYKAPAVLLHNRESGGHWLEVKLVGTTSNRDAVGARVQLRAGSQTQVREVHAGSGYLSTSTLVQHFGLGDADRVDEVTIKWPSGATSELRGIDADERWIVREGDERAVVVERWVDPRETRPGEARIARARD